MQRREGPLVFSDLVVNLQAWEVRLRGEPVDLTKTEFQILVTLASRPRTVVTNEELIDVVWGENWYGDDGNLAVRISKLRTKLGESGATPRYIRTVRGVGYRFEPDPEGIDDRSTATNDRRHQPSVTLLISKDRSIQWVSPQVRELLGWDPLDLVGSSPLKLAHPDDVAALLTAEPALDAAESFSFQARMRTATGDYHVVTHTIRSIYDSDGAFTGFLGEWQPLVDSDGTVSLEPIMLAPIEASAHTVTLIYDANLVLVDVSPRVPIGGWRPEEIIGQFFSPSDRDEDAMRSLIDTFVATGVRVAGGIVNIRCRDGSLTPVHGHSHLDLDSDGNLAGYRIVLHIFHSQ